MCSFSIALNESRLKVADEFRDIDPEEQSDVRAIALNESRLKVADEFRDIDPEEQSDVRAIA